MRYIDETNVDNEMQYLYSDIDDEIGYSRFYESLSRTKSTIRKLAYFNNWEYFCIFTFDDAITDRYNYTEVSKKIRKFFSNYRQRYSTDFHYNYMIVPSVHSDGAVHFIGMISNAKTLYKAEKLLKNISGELIEVDNTKDYFILPQYNLGFAYINKVVNKNKCGGLMMRRVNNFPYIEKGTRLLYASKGLNKKD